MFSGCVDVDFPALRYEQQEGRLAGAQPKREARVAKADAARNAAHTERPISVPSWVSQSDHERPGHQPRRSRLTTSSQRSRVSDACASCGSHSRC